MNGNGHNEVWAAVAVNGHLPGKNPEGQNLPLNRKMERKSYTFGKREETIDSSNKEVKSNAPKSNESKKCITISGIIEKRTSRTTDLSPDHKRRYETSVFLSREEKSSDFSGGKTVKKKKILQVHLHNRKSETAPPPLKPSKEMTGKESTSCKLPDQLVAPKPSLPPRKSSTSTWRKESSNLYMTLYEEVPEVPVKEDLNAIHKACKIFGKVRGGKIYVNDLPMVLNTLKVSMNDSEIRRALKAIDIDAFQNALKIFSKMKGGRVSTDEVDAVLDSLDIHTSPETVHDVLKYTYTDPPVEDSGLKETGTNKRLSYIAPYKKKSSSSRPSESSLLKKLEMKSFQSFSNVLEKDDSEYKEPKVSLQPRKFSDVVDSSHVDVQEPYSKHETDLRKLSENEETSDSKSKSQSLRSNTSLNKFLEKSDITNISKPQKPARTRHSTLLKHISFKEKPAVNTLENELVNLDDFITTLSKEQSFHEYDVLTNGTNAVKKFEDEKVDSEDVNTSLEEFGIHLPKPEVEKPVELTEADKLPRVTENIQNLSQELMSISDTLSNVNSDLKKDNFLDELKLAKVDDDKVQLKEFEKIVKNMHDASRLKSLQEIALALDSLEGEMIAEENLEDFLKNVGIKSPKEEAENILQSDFVSEGNMVNVNDWLKSLKETPKFSNFIDFRNEAVPSNLKLPEMNAIELLLAITQILQDDLVDVSDLKTLLVKDDLDTANVVLTEILRNLPEYEEKNTFYNVNIRKSDPKTISDIQQNLNAIGIHLTDDETQKVLDNTNPNDEVVSFKDVIRELANTDDFVECQRIEDAWLVVNTVSDGKAEVKELLSTLKNLENPLNEDQLGVSLNSAADENKIVSKDIIDSFTDSSKPSPFNKNDEVSLKQILENLDKSKPSSSFEDVQELSKALNKVSTGKVDVADVQPVGKGLKTHASEGEVQKIVSSISVDNVQELSKALKKFSTGKVDVADVQPVGKGLKTHASEGEVQKIVSSISADNVQELSKALNKVSTGKVDVADVQPVGKGLKTHASEGEVQKIVSSISVDNVQELLKALKKVSTGKVDVADVQLVGKGLKTHASEGEVQKIVSSISLDNVQELSKALNKVSTGKVDVADVQPVGKGLKTHASEGEVQKIVSSISVDNVQELSKALNKVSTGKVDVADVPPVRKSLKTHASEGEIQKRVSSISVDKVQELSKALNKVSTGKVDVGDVQPVQKGLKAHASEGEVQKIVSSISLDNVQELSKALDKVSTGKVEVVDVQPVRKSLKTHASEGEVQKIVSSISLDNVQELSKALNKVSTGKVDVADVQPVRKGLKTHASEGEVQKIVSSISVDNVQELSKALKKFSTGKVDVADVQPVPKSLKTHASEGEVQKIVSSISLDNVQELSKALNKVSTGRVDVADVQPVRKDVQELSKALNKVSTGKVDVGDVQPVRKGLKTHASEGEVQKIVSSISLDNVQELSKSLNKVSTGKVDVADVQPVHKGLKTYASEGEVQKIVSSISVDNVQELSKSLNKISTGKVDVADVQPVRKSLKTHASEGEVQKIVSSISVDNVQELSKALNKVSTGKVDVADVQPVLKGLNTHASEGEVQKIVSSISLDNVQELSKTLNKVSTGKVDVTDVQPVRKSLKTHASEGEVQKIVSSISVDNVQELSKALNKVSIGKVDVADVQPVQKGLKTHASEGEVQKIVSSISVDNVQELSKALNKVSTGRVDVADVQPVRKGLKAHASEGEVQKIVSSISVDREKIDVNNVDTVLQNIGIPLIEGEPQNLQEHLSSTDEKVGFDDISIILEKKGSHFSDKESEKLSLHESEDTIAIRDLDSSLGYMGTELIKEELDELKRNLPDEETYKLPNLSQEDINHLNRPLRSNEMEEAKNLPTRKSPGPNGFTAGFYKTFKDELTQVLFKLFHEVKMEGSLPNILYKASVTASPKQAKAETDLKPLTDRSEVTSGSQVDVHDVDSFLGNMTLKPTPSEPSDLSSDLVVDERGESDTSDMKKIPEIMEIELENKDHWEMVNDQPMNERKIDVNNLDSILGRMEINHIEEEIEKQTENLQTEEKTDLRKLTDAVKVESGEEADVSNVESVLENISPELTARGSQVLMENVLVDYKTYEMRLEDDVRSLQDSEKTYEMRLEEGIRSLQGRKVSANDIIKVLGNMGIELTEKEFTKLLQVLPTDDAGKVYENKLLDGVKSIKGKEEIWLAEEDLEKSTM
ncbi:PREDICTED: EF-hand calcium-binding domain-containing protein 13 [Dipodomys ordii]|uniref:EF-hand calcium-binding domain-containing protein 13 n=1 Tax=Dipodomys ordii TaxID=10020 RepID=A0A1S3GJ12_DIPOR|nr:PREDICTED: EF-hand calcium-binding domain-containing protein 13 [Dipodomys ordii]